MFVANYFTLKFSGAGRSALVLEKEIGGGQVLEKEFGGLDIIFDIFSSVLLIKLFHGQTKGATSVRQSAPTDRENINDG